MRWPRWASTTTTTGSDCAPSSSAVGEVSEDELKAHVKASLARFKVPREIVFVDELPRNATGKILKRELADWTSGDDA